jgi:hypothetical protein
MALSKEKRKKIEKTVIDTFSILDKSGVNAKRYMDLFKSMSDTQFEAYAKRIAKDPNFNYQLEIIPFDREPTLDDIKEAADYLKLPLEEYVYHYHEGRDGLRTREKVPVGLTYLRVN